MSVERRPVRVLCVDDQSCIRDAMRELVVATPGFAWAGETISGDEALAAVTQIRPDVVLLDVWMPGLNGFATAELILGRRRGTIVVLVSADPIDIPSEYGHLHGRVALVRKQDLCPRVLLDLWYGRAWVLRYA